MQTATHLHFKGNCSEAFKFYADTFGGQIAFALTFGASPCAQQTPPEFHDKILHARLDFGGQMLLGCDTLCDYQAPQGFNVMAGVDDRTDAERIFNALAADGTVTMPFQETFWARGFGMCTDRFGTPWIVNCAKPHQDALAAAA